jgi:hypothetical protein
MLWLADIQIVLWFGDSRNNSGGSDCRRRQRTHTRLQRTRIPLSHSLAISSRLLPGIGGSSWWEVLTLARFSEAFLVLRAQQTGLSVTWIPLVMVVMALFGALSAYPAGWLSDRIAVRNCSALAGLSSWRIWCLLSPVLSSL